MNNFFKVLLASLIVVGSTQAAFAANNSKYGKIFDATSVADNDERNNLCIGVANSSTENGAEVVTWRCQPRNTDQMWRAERIQALHAGRIQDGVLLRNELSNKCLAVAGGTRLDTAGEQAKIIIWPCDGSHTAAQTGQFWQVLRDGSILNVNSDKCLTVDPDHNLGQFVCEPSLGGQTWKPQTFSALQSLEYKGRWVAIANCVGCDAVNYSITVGLEKGNEKEVSSETTGSLSLMVGIEVGVEAPIGPSVSASTQFTASSSETEREAVVSSFSRSHTVVSDFPCNKGALYQWQSTLEQEFGGGEREVVEANAQVYRCTTADDVLSHQDVSNFDWQPCNPVEIGTDFLSGAGASNTLSLNVGDSGFVCESSLTPTQKERLKKIRVR